jgi:hypothetical protein
VVLLLVYLVPFGLEMDNGTTDTIHFVCDGESRLRKIWTFANTLWPGPGEKKVMGKSRHIFPTIIETDI